MIHDKAPHIRKIFQEQSANEGADFNMLKEAYEGPGSRLLFHYFLFRLS